MAAGDYAGGAQALSAFAAVVIAESVVDEVRRRMRDDDEETIANAVVQNAVGYVPIAGDVLRPIVRHAMGLNTFGGRQNLLVSQVNEGVTGIQSLMSAIHSAYFDKLKADGSPESVDQFVQAADKLANAVMPLLRLPYKGVRDPAIMAYKHAIGPENSEVAKRLRAQLNADTNMSDTRRRILAAIKANDDASFVEAVKAAQASGTKVDAGYLRYVVTGRFRNLDYADRQLAKGKWKEEQLSQEQQEALSALRLERESLLESLSGLLQLNFD
jgi:hypothetical protein